MKYPWCKLIGVEFEGGWNDDDIPDSELGSWHEDNSMDRDYLEDMGADRSGEFATFPFPYDQIKEVITSCCPQYVHETYFNNEYDEDENETLTVDKSCGLHFHISFSTNEYYLRLLSDEFLDLLVHNSSEWARRRFGSGSYQYKRLKYGNDYATKTVGTIQELSLGNLERYRFINASAFKKHGTLEFRLHPSYDSPTYVIEALDVLMESIDLFLSCTEPKYKDTIKNSLIVEDLVDNVQDVLSIDLHITETPTITLLEINN